MPRFAAHGEGEHPWMAWKAHAPPAPAPPLKHPSGVWGGSPARQPARRPGQHCLTWQEPPGALVGGGQHDGLAGLTWHVMTPKRSHISIPLHQPQQQVAITSHRPSVSTPSLALCRQPLPLHSLPTFREILFPPTQPRPASPFAPRKMAGSDLAGPPSPHRRLSCPPAGPFVGPLEGEWAARGQLGFETPRPLDSRCRHGFEGHGLLSVVPRSSRRGSNRGCGRANGREREGG